MKIKVWLHAFRLRTLPLALACIGMAGFLAAAAGKFDLVLFTLCCLTTIFLQVLSNLANDYGDSLNGADHEGRKGPLRAVQSGVISAAQMRSAVIVFSLLSLICGLFLLWVSFGTNWRAMALFFCLGLMSIAAAIGYTVGKKPYGYIGLGDISVLIFFGLVGVMGSYYLFTHTISWKELLPALSCGLFSIAVLNINNIRDIESDRIAGKYSIPVRIGKEMAVRYHWILLIGGILSAIVYIILHYKSPWQFLFLITVPLFVKNGLSIHHKPSEELDPFLKQMALSTLLFVLLFGIGLIL
ncbi:MAG TPA: 1,4-dihydroxy-2-naphthoate polyprenyltransferase [Cyclobacteriaceae bacterium]|nr:1,4-dihydroxy-2-naphthoate polyprenyltransferase [Cyclobacteriaceae bacterium]HPW62265.1 1,4-dihydroxy-2-naphthoate polyprenyltransferase [Cyclobacteriaceae bacterium]